MNPDTKLLCILSPPVVQGSSITLMGAGDSDSESSEEESDEQDVSLFVWVGVCVNVV